MNLGTAKWIWCEDHAPNTYCYARGRLDLAALPIGATLRIVADSRYQVWVNGHYIGQGPTPFKRPHVFVDSFDITAQLRAGENAIAVLGNYHGVNHCTYTVGKPGILAHVEATDADGKTTSAVTDTSWKVRRSLAYARNVPRRTWATAWCEYFDARREAAAWREAGFDDSAWANARVVDQGTLACYPRMVPPLEEGPVEATRIAGLFTARTGIPPLTRSGQGDEEAGLTLHLDTEPLHAIARRTARAVCPAPAAGLFPIVIKPSDHGFAIIVDFGRETAGQVEIDVETSAGTVLDICPAECLGPYGRAWCRRKEGHYARRYITRAGRQSWRGFGYDGFRYIHVVVRGPHPQVVLHRIGAWKRQSALPIRAVFESGNREINRIWDITCTTMRLGSQEVHVDCPTREQTSAWGDHVWSGLWAAYMTGNASALKHLMLSAGHVQMPNGQIPCYAFSELIPHPHPLYDYSLICVWGIWLYVRTTGDRDLASRLIPVGDRVLAWHEQVVGRSGLIEMDCDKLWADHKGQLFIDHPGMGWHSCPHGHPGIDRRGFNAAFNFFYIHALDAQAELLAYMGEKARAARLRRRAHRVRQAAEKHFYNPAENAYVDGWLDGEQLSQISQQTNALAVTSGTCPPKRARKVLQRILRRPGEDRSLCLAGTYFWTYLAAALCKAGMHAEMWREVVFLWNDMAERGATSWWETFLGDELDSLCHLWSAVPGYLALAEILGIQPAEPGFRSIRIRPRFDVQEQAKGTMPVPGGSVSVGWKREGGGVQLKVQLTTNAPAVLELPPGWKTGQGRKRIIDLSTLRAVDTLVNKRGVAANPS